MAISDNKIKDIPRHYMINCKNKWEILRRKRSSG